MIRRCATQKDVSTVREDLQYSKGITRPVMSQNRKTLRSLAMQKYNHDVFRSPHSQFYHKILRANPIPQS